MTEDEKHMRKAIVRHAASLFNRGLTPGTSGNISVRLKTGVLLTPSGIGFDALTPDSLPLVDFNGTLLSGPEPTKEMFLHLAWYRTNDESRAIVHLHSPNAAALACLAGVDPDEVIPPITPYFVRDLGPVPLISYRHPGDVRLGDDIFRLGRGRKAVLLANHGLVAGGSSLERAVAASEEFEAAAGIFLKLDNGRIRCLDRTVAADLNPSYGPPTVSPDVSPQTGRPLPEIARLPS